MKIWGFLNFAEIGGICNMHHWLRGDERPCLQQYLLHVIFDCVTLAATAAQLLKKSPEFPKQ